MQSWPVPHIDSVPGTPSPLHLYDSADGEVKRLNIKGETATMYVCGITPYDSTHLGHAATYLTFDLIYRQLLDNGYKVNYAQNITDVDDPLFERAERDGVDWRELGTSQINLFRSDMELLSVFPPQHFVGAMEAIDEITEMVQALLDAGAAYVVDDPDYPDVYASIEATKNFGYESNYSREQMETFFAERGGDPERPGKRDPLDALIWRAHREGEPAWESPFGPGRPGWHIECSAIATNRLGSSFDIQGGGSDLKFPHHEFSAAHAEAALGVERMAQSYVHTGMIGLEGTKMSKSLGNLVFVHKLVEAGVDPSAIRLGVFSGHYREDRDWSDEVLHTAQERLERWRAASRNPGTVEEIKEVVHNVRLALAEDLDTQRAIAVLDQWAEQALGAAEASEEASDVLRTAVNSLLGVRL
ncbi:cysteine--1-D-myo-inosityl 2-amino-2-deoxy-alpha-D-glucopyranoside ligase [Corynebacterium aurimucosum]|uniref:L-cysteine:1D-myo-inositol 2-amino-2-deoxy-alpha-D-glucopyranoside ligase n=1 Tax=Corynebacterium aurimucosum (strain ATCC 700975 / DSM 44827 / CIP 107346 / CN-1) TaxID=548476 RepID=MSHC_CORA7|nr:cysteine--1-D-myo-inosityl 2-amino-2-deoxy-alpha-D-glucopyranoside ligase [Corynebacterium aurimucosum]C3PG89.1 RecName: Full=L-cysteine:1D-myo-inositol 2-amino-2-deoxy-alpha-D-glucopyranoside ligase; Short=L-Cys:GlcN-Ins ligase; AltName: Full=Mycothiol ligase; Short=MSH ligase [Corynebacterium aurimucosum ATCC 700975]ACP32843.1 MshC ligase [Corynebacterium aurimucosum ATCC 700975]QQU92999.1 cysteine--1-D-myo-inosityl 2-amino-2-deoxy-alpha-D-glucopyranoside ligase [Corynebacterium aurimucosum